jgi:hypothetical protein
MTHSISAGTPAPAFKHHDWWYIGIDETSHWNLPANLRPFVDRIITVYGFDRASHTYCCELTPSHWLTCCDFSVRYKDEDTPGFTDHIRELIEETVSTVAKHESDGYYHARDIDRLLSKDETTVPRYHRGMRAQDDDDDNDLVEFWVCNPRF